MKRARQELARIITLLKEQISTLRRREFRRDSGQRRIESQSGWPTVIASVTGSIGKPIKVSVSHMLSGSLLSLLFCELCKFLEKWWARQGSNL
jgi:hypothetical protein